MLELDLHIYSKPIGIKNKYGFDRPIIMYLVNSQFVYLTTFLVVDFTQDRLTYIKTLTPENLKKVQDLGTDHQNMRDSSHSSFCFDINKGFFNFLSQLTFNKRNSFRWIDLQTNKMTCFFGEDFGYKNTRFSETSRTTDPEYFVLAIDQQEDEDMTYYLKCRKDNPLDFTYFGKMPTRYPPHQCYYHDDKVFTTEFFERHYITRDGERLKDDPELETYFNDKYKNPSNVIMDKLCSNMIGMDAGHGEIKQLNADGTYKVHKTEFCPSHIEHDLKDDVFYISSHNFISLRMLTKMLYLAPAAINKYKYDGENLIHQGKFQHPTGFRFSEHKVWRYEGKPYVTTFGHPNRLFVIDAETMDLHYYYDMLGSVLDDKEDIRTYLNTEDPHHIDDPFRFSTMEMSRDGRYGVLLSRDDILIFDQLERRIVESAPLYKEEGYLQKTYHSETV